MASSPSAAEQLATNLNPLAKDTHGGNLSAAPQDYVTLSQDALNSSASAQAPTSTTAVAAGLLLDIASSSSSASALVNDLNRLGTDLAGNALNDVSRLLTAVSVMNIGATASGSSTQSVASAAAAQLIQETLQAMTAGDGAAVNTDLSQLASLLSEMRRINYGGQAGEAEEDVFVSNPTNPLTQIIDGNCVSLSPYDLSLLAWHLFGAVPPHSEQYEGRETRKKLRRVTSRRFAEAQWSVIVFLAGFQESDDLREALDYIFSEESLRGFARRLMREADPASTPKWQMELIDEMAACRDLNQNPYSS